MMALHIAANELRRSFLSPLAWVVLAVVQFIGSWIFLVRIERFQLIQGRIAGVEGAPGVSDLVAAPVFGSMSVVLLMVVPLLAMRPLAEERRAGSLPLLLSAPVSMTEIVLGKYLGLLGFLLIVVAAVAAMPLSLIVATDLDLGKLAAATGGLALMTAAFAAASLFMSSLTRHPVVAAVSSFGLLLLLWIIDWASTAGEEGSEVLRRLSLVRHYESFLQGMIDTGDVVFYLLFAFVFIAFAVRRMDAERLQH